MANPEYPDYPEGHDPASVFAERLASAQGSGLPFSATLGSPGIGTPGQARPALAPVEVQGQDLGHMGRIGRILQSFGSGMQGQLAPWQQIQMAEQDRALKQQQLAQQQQMQQAQIPHLQAQTLAAGVSLLEPLQGMLANVPEEKRGAILDAIAPSLASIFQSGAPDPTTKQFADAGFIRSMLETAGGGYREFLDAYPFLDEKQKQALLPLIRAKNYEKALKTAGELSTQNREAIVLGLGQRLQRTPKPSGGLWTLGDALTAVQATPLERAAVQMFLKTEKPDAVNAIFDSLGVVSPLISVKGAEAQATALGQESTPGGKAKIAETKASTVLKGQEAIGAGVKTVPGQGGALITLPGTIAAGVTGGGVVGTGGTGQPAMAGLQTPPGVGILAQTPGAPMQPQAAADIAKTEEIVRTLKRIGTYEKDKTLYPYIGPISTRPMGALTEAIQTKTPFGGTLPPRVADLQQGAGQLANYTIQNITGAAVRETEEPRILREVPDLKRDKPEIFWQKYHQTLQTNEVLLARKKAMLGPDGRQRADVNPDDVAAQYPLPVPLPESVMGPQGKARVKPGSSNATGR